MKLLNTLLNNDPTYTMFMPLPVHNVLWGFKSDFIAHLESLLPSFIKKLIPNLPDPFIALQVSVKVFIMIDFSCMAGWFLSKIFIVFSRNFPYPHMEDIGYSRGLEFS